MWPKSLYEGISIHALREEGDRPRPLEHGSNVVFLSTPSARRATPALLVNAGHHRISIHALREEGDSTGSIVSSRCLPISIHALREEGDPPGRSIGNE